MKDLFEEWMIDDVLISILSTLVLRPTDLWSLTRCHRGLARTENAKRGQATELKIGRSVASTQTETDAEMEASGAGHERSLMWVREAGSGVLMSAELISREGGTDEVREMKSHELMFEGDEENALKWSSDEEGARMGQARLVKRVRQPPSNTPPRNMNTCFPEEPHSNFKFVLSLVEPPTCYVHGLHVVVPSGRAGNNCLVPQ
ncbi:hypothetical protein BLNAU_4134 [Blattamonas nauphoetae]|uniref:F-box domain-containing protein n=1 Tax=Blattamonas nauphoetae TaxID=2049346 RepID=A0ABQ9YB97_9EUKA|nr:hypothetical protein BLNAU_4134 [Blattamonas nauphoetae]